MKIKSSILARYLTAWVSSAARKIGVDSNQKLNFLAFVLDSECMMVSPTPERGVGSKMVPTIQRATIRELPEIIGKLVATFQVCAYWPLHYRQQEVTRYAR